MSRDDPPRRIRMHARDNVAIVANDGGLPAGTVFPDGLTLWFAASPTITISPNVMSKMPFDPAKALTPVAPILSYANVLVVNKDSKYYNLADFIAAAKEGKEKMSYGHAGLGGCRT